MYSAHILGTRVINLAEGDYWMPFLEFFCFVCWNKQSYAEEAEERDVRFLVGETVCSVI